MKSPASSALVRFSALALCAALLAWGCAAGDDDTAAASTSAGGSGTTTSGAGGDVGSGGMGGSGGDGDLCAEDCNAIVPPPCLVSVCNEGAYPGPVGKCTIVPDEDGTACEDGLFCTIDDTCQQGQCTAGPSNDCGQEAPDCAEITCDEDGKSCGTQPAGDGLPCNSDDLCTVNATCLGGNCQGGTPVSCIFAPVPNDCHVAICNPQTGMCDPVVGNDGDSCSDSSDLCTVNKTCAAGNCVGGSPKDCSQLTMGCNSGVCDAVTGQCTTMAVGEGQLCDDTDHCTMGETCAMGVCGMGSPVTTCSLTGDGCCPPNCTAQDDYDCNCPGTFVNGICIYLDNPANSYPFASAQAQCQGMGAGWDLCSPTVLCDPQVFTYLNGEGCDCSGGATACSCGSAANVYVHVTGGASPYYIRAPELPNCGGAACTDSVSETCGVALCCRP